MSEPTSELREALARWLFERDYRERGLASPDDAPWDEWSDRNQNEWREEAEELLDLPVVTDWAEQRARERATAEVSDVDGLRETLADALRGKQWVRKVMDDGYTSLLQADEFDLADAVLPVVTAYAEQRARERAAEELRAAVDWLSTGAAGRPGPLRMIARKLHDRADALDRTGER